MHFFKIFVLIIFLYTASLDYSSKAFSEEKDILKQQKFEDRMFFKKNLKQFITIKHNRIKSSAVKGVFDAVFYKLEITVFDNASESKVAKNSDSKLVRLSGWTTTSQQLPDFLKMLDSNFKLNDESSFKMQGALDSLFPISDAFGGKDLEAKTLYKEGNKWYFIRGVFFERLKGFIFTVEEDGTIVNAEYSLDINKT